MLSIVCPVYNEAENIEKLFNEIDLKIKTHSEIIVVYDMDEDTTIPVIKRISGKYKSEIKLIKNFYGIGVLNAIKTGFDNANGSAVLVVMADLSDDLRVVDEMYRLVNDDGYDVVCGSRYMRGGKQIGGPFIKKTLSRLAGLSLHFLTGINTHDPTNSFKMYSRSFIDSIKIESDGGFEIGIELVSKAFVMNRKITELPSVWKDRTSGKSRFKMWKWMSKYLKWYFYTFKKFFNSSVSLI